MIKLTRTVHKCYVSSAAGVPLDTLRESLLAHNIQPLLPETLLAGSDWGSEIQRQLLDSDLVIGVLPDAQRSSWVLFELGQAWALGKQILLIVAPGSEPLPHNLQRLLVLKTDPSNKEAIDFALDQLLSSPADTQRSPILMPFKRGGLGDQV